MIPKNYTSILIIFVLLYFSHTIQAQQNSFHTKINKDIYHNFSKAYQTLDYDLFAAIHSNQMIRISGDGGSIKNSIKYLKGYKKRWSNPERKPVTIDFRLFERIHSDSLVSDRGIYQVTYTNDNKQSKNSYGQFHVVLQLENDKWKILIDYDSNENNTINQNKYENAFSLGELEKYLKVNK